MSVDVYIPAHPDRCPILAGSGIVGRHSPAGLLQLDYEGNLYGASGLTRWADRVHHAWSRQSNNYPTVARSQSAPEAMLRLASYNPDTGVLDLAGSDLAPERTRTLLAAWLSLQVDALAEELSTAGDARHDLDRSLAQLRTQGPAGRFAADRLARLRRHG